MFVSQLFSPDETKITAPSTAILSVVEQLLAPPTMLTGGLGRGRVPAYHCTAIFSANEGFEALLEVRVLILTWTASVCAKHSVGDCTSESIHIEHEIDRQWYEFRCSRNMFSKYTLCS
jgi:hypothetical protein